MKKVNNKVGFDQLLFNGRPMIADWGVDEKVLEIRDGAYFCHPNVWRRFYEYYVDRVPRAEPLGCPTINDLPLTHTKVAMKKSTVIAIAVIVFLVILGFDLYLYTDSIPGNSLTQIVIWLSEKSHLVPFGFGFFFGFLTCHFFE